MFAQCLSATTGALHLFKVLIDSGALACPLHPHTFCNYSAGAPVDVRNNLGLTALDMADNAEIRAVLIDACVPSSRSEKV